MPVLSKLKRWLCCGIGEKEIEPSYEPKAVKKHIRRGLVPPGAAIRWPRSNSCPAKLDFASVSIENGSHKRYECRASGDNSGINDADNDSSESRKIVDEIEDYPSVKTKENDIDSKIDDPCSSAISLDNCSTISIQENMERRIQLLIEQLDSSSSGSDYDNDSQINSISENQAELDSQQDLIANECSSCIPKEASETGIDHDFSEDENLLTEERVDEKIIPETREASDAEKDVTKFPTHTVDINQPSEPADALTCMSMLRIEHGVAMNESLPTVQSESSISASTCGEAKEQKSSLKDKIAAFSNFGFGRSALYCRAPQRFQLKAKRVPAEDSDDEEGQHIWGRTRRPRSLRRNREDSQWLQSRARTPASRIGRNLRPIYHALHRAEEANLKRRIKNADWLSVREVMKMANLKRKYRLTKTMRHSRLTLRNAQILR